MPLTPFKQHDILEALPYMTPEILAKILGIIAKTGEKVVVVDPQTGAPFVIMGLDGYQALIDGRKSGIDTPGRPPLTGSSPSGMIDPDLSFSQETKAMGGGQWGGDETEDRFYMEPVE